MSARKAYISSLGTTGLLVAAALAMLIVVGALVAFDRWPTLATAEAESVQIADEGTEVIRRAAKPRALARSGATAPAATGAFARASSDALRAAAARAGRVERAIRSAEPGSSARVKDPVVSDLPAPDSAADVPAQSPAAAPDGTSAPGTGTPGGAGSPVLTLPPAPVNPTGGDGLGEVTTQLGDGVSQLSPQLGQTVRGTGTTVTGTIDQLLERGGN